MQQTEHLYDTYNRLTKQRWNIEGKSFSESYTYDTAGNIRTETKTVGTATTTKSYTYSNGSWKDLLTAVGNSSIAYEGQTYSNGTVSGNPVSGNPIHYTNGVKTFTNLTWEHGRQLVSLTNTTNNVTYTYDYNADGIRTKKVVDGVTHTYVTQNGRVVQESYPYGDTTIIMLFFYDEQGRPFSLQYSKDGGINFSQYYYAINAQGDVEGIFFTRKNTTSGKQEIHWMGHYTYDAWGNITSIVDPEYNTVTSTANLMIRNPIRCRGYYYDTETGFYYVSSRYYDPEIGRFINADSYTSTGQGFLGYNMFAYCLNNPVCRKDVLGTTSVECKDDDGDPTDDDKDINGGKMGDDNSRMGGLDRINSGGYKPPSGGGGVTDSVTVKDVKVDFGHGGRHLDGTGVSEADMNNAIANDVVNRSLPSGHATRFPITVHGIDFCYSAIQLGANHINIGTYYPVIKQY